MGMPQQLLNADTPPALSQNLLLSITEQLKLPLLSIARQAELAGMMPAGSDFAAIRTTAETALQLLDNYLLGVQLACQETSFGEAEPVSVSSVLYDAGEQLRPMAAAYGVKLDLHVDGRYGPVMAHRRGLQAALVSLGYALVEALPAAELPQLRLQLSAHRCRYGIVAGLYCDAEQVAAETLKYGRQLYGHARQPLGALSHTSSAGVFVADAILRAMQSQLTVSHHRNLHGLGTVLSLSPQLQLV